MCVSLCTTKDFVFVSEASYQWCLLLAWCGQKRLLGIASIGNPGHIYGGDTDPIRTQLGCWHFIIKYHIISQLSTH